MGSLPIPERFSIRLFNAIHGLIPGESQKILETYLKSIVSAKSSKLGLGLIVSVALALWGARAGTVSLIQTLNITYEKDEKRGTIRFQAVALAMTLVAILSALVALALIAAIPPVLTFLPLRSGRLGIFDGARESGSKTGLAGGANWI